MSSIMVARKTIDIRRTTEAIQGLRTGDLIRFRGAHQTCIVRIKAAIPYQDVQTALEHEPLAKLYPQMAHPAEALELISKHINADEAVYALHFDVADNPLSQPDWATTSASASAISAAFKSPVK
ncbi:Hypothetical Protein FCC1311_035542 [Hondaea fermentalgiana]|uniref:ASCH domain-containing protein n=1 Tax=Hondaea fermentalgiana TaxID=2315210 RepID=A0A2R5G8E7_9STRA|nr:Hypothetical Protein FCC1311_035542 [Hondaea fermentalgiana]|eukprot:GBG27332.1 Hypothetical Protein FCC1311_035542 [Hondaea fermentalgiana]